MASALMAFARSLGNPESSQPIAQTNRDADAQSVASEDEFEHENGDQDPLQHQQTSLAVFAKQQAHKDPPAVSLVQIAQQHGQHGSAKSTNQPTLAMFAAQVNHEDAVAAMQRDEKVQSALRTTSEQVRAQVQAKQREAVELAVQQAILEEQQQYQQDEFEDDDPAIHHAANLLLAKTSTAAGNSNKVSNNQASPRASAPGQMRSVDRHVLTQRQQLHGLQNKCSTKAKTMKDRLSTFQFQQLSLTQRRVFLATLTGDSNNNGRSTNKKCNMEAIHELAKDKAKIHRQKHSRSKKPEFAKLDDNRHCRFKPRFCTGGQKQRSAQKSGNDSDDDGGNNAAQRNEDFVRRMEAAERAKNEQLRRTREEKAYLARVDKKECPLCGNPQSYSELSQKRKKCPNCGVTYKNRIAWSEIATQFLERMEEYVEARVEAKRQREEQQLRGLAATARRRSNNNNNNNNNKSRVHGDDGEVLTWGQVQDEFLGRVQQDLTQRELTRDAILHKMQEECSFTPSISSKAKKLNLGTFDERLRRDLESRRARQEQYKILVGAIAADSAAQAKAAKVREMPLGHKATNRRVYVAPANFQERLRLDLEKRRERMQDNRGSDPGGRGARPKHAQIKW